jgi:hypothetical protein
MNWRIKMKITGTNASFITHHFLQEHRRRHEVLMKTVITVFALAIVAFACSGASGQEFSIILLPDTQYYTDQCADMDIYQNQTEWIVDHESELNIQFVIHLGDITNNAVGSMWDIAETAHEELRSAGIPFSLIPGNHDYDQETFAECLVGSYHHVHMRQTGGYRGAFDAAHWSPPWFEGQYESGIANTFSTFEHSGLQFLILNLEFAPRKDVLCWASQVLGQHPNHRVIVATHCYQRYDGIHSNCTDVPRSLICGDTPGYPDDEPAIIGADGWNLWDEFIRRHSNIFMVLSGHINDSAHVQRRGLAGNVVHEILSDYQYEAPLGTGRCGNGWLRVLTFKPSENEIDLVTLSTMEGDDEIFDIPDWPEFYRDNYRPDPATDDHHLSIPYDMATSVPYSFTEGTAHFNDLRVNSIGSGNQRTPQIAMDTDGSWITVWEDDLDDNGSYDIRMRGMRAGGRELFSQRTVNEATSGPQDHPSVAMMDNAECVVVVWEDDFDNNGYDDVRMRGFDQDGNERFSDRHANATTTGQQDDPYVAMDPLTGNFVVVWEDDNDHNDSYDIRMRGFDADGNETFSERVVNSETSGQQRDPVVAMREGGDFVVAWRHDGGNDGYFDIHIRGFYASGSARFSDRQVNLETSGQQDDPALAMNRITGGFAVTWEDDLDGNDSFDIRARAYYENGTPRSVDYMVNSESSGDQRNPDIAMSGTGRFVVVWQDDQDGNDYDEIMARGFFGGGSLWFADMTINSEGSGQQQTPRVAMRRNQDSFVTVWKDDLDKNDSFDILGRGIQHYDVVTTAAGGGTVSAGTTTLPSSSMFGLIAEADPGHEFVRWSGEVENPSAASTNVCVDEDKLVTAHFAPIDNAVGSGLVSYWSFDTGFEADFGGDAYDGVEHEVAIVDAGQFGNAASFNGTNSYVEITAPVIEQGVDHTFSAWYQLEVTDIPSNLRYFVLETNGEGGGEVYSASYGLLDQGSGDEGQVYTTAVPGFNSNMMVPGGAGQSWHNIIVTYDASMAEHSTYLDGVHVGSFDSHSLLQDTDGLVIGAHRDFGRNWEGLIDEVAFWDRVLTSEEISTLQTETLSGALVNAPLPEVTSVFSLSQNHPNPFNPVTTIEFSLEASGRTRLQVFDVRGHLVSTVVNELLTAGKYERQWNGRTDSGRKVASGVYTYRLETPTSTETKRMLLLK